MSGGGKQRWIWKKDLFSQLFYDIFKNDISNLFGKGKEEGSWLGPWAMSAAGCFVCCAEILTGARVEAGEGPAASPTQGEGFFLCLAAGNEARHQTCQKCRLLGPPQTPSKNRTGDCVCITA